MVHIICAVLLISEIVLISGVPDPLDELNLHIHLDDLESGAKKAPNSGVLPEDDEPSEDAAPVNHNRGLSDSSECQEINCASSFTNNRGVNQCCEIENLQINNGKKKEHYVEEESKETEEDDEEDDGTGGTSVDEAVESTEELPTEPVPPVGEDDGGQSVEAAEDTESMEVLPTGPAPPVGEGDAGQSVEFSEEDSDEEESSMELVTFEVPGKQKQERSFGSHQREVERLINRMVEEGGQDYGSKNGKSSGGESGSELVDVSLIEKLIKQEMNVILPEGNLANRGIEDARVTRDIVIKTTAEISKAIIDRLVAILTKAEGKKVGKAVENVLKRKLHKITKKLRKKT